jgi:hypothetical protein
MYYDEGDLHQKIDLTVGGKFLTSEKNREKSLSHSTLYLAPSYIFPPEPSIQGDAPAMKRHQSPFIQPPP